MEKLDLSNKNLTKISKDMFPTTLTELNLSNNDLRVIEQETFKHLINLKVLNLSNNKQLQTINYGNIPFGNRDLYEILQYLRNLESLDISNCCFYELPFEMIFLDNLCECVYHSNPIIYDHKPLVKSFLYKKQLLCSFL